MRLAGLVEAAGFPQGALNVVTGAGGTGAALSQHPGVDKISFTGSVPTGQRLVVSTGFPSLPVHLVALVVSKVASVVVEGGNRTCSGHDQCDKKCAETELYHVMVVRGEGPGFNYKKIDLHFDLLRLNTRKMAPRIRFFSLFQVLYVAKCRT